MSFQDYLRISHGVVDLIIDGKKSRRILWSLS